jgi:DNA ligase-1
MQKTPMRQSKFHRDIPNNMKMIQQPLPTLYHQSKSGSIVKWNIWTEGADIVREYGQMDGKMQVARTTATGKNIGRSNETTPEEQALLEAAAKHKKRLDMKYSLSIKDAKQEVFLPMLASSFDKRKDKVSYPLDVQPKLDGVRCMAYWEGDSVKLMSRGGKYWECCDHIVAELEQVLPKGWVLDGELYVHGATFQEITRLVKKLRPESVTVKYHVYDVPRAGAIGEQEPIVSETNHEWEGRKEHLNELARFVRASGATAPSRKSVKVVRTDFAAHEEDVYELQSEYLEEGYEGAIVRERDGEYKFGYRSNKLLKVKNFMDEEYEIVGFTTGVGRFEGCCIWICETADGQSFKVVPQGTMDLRKETFNNADKNVGKWLKVKYFELTDDGIPRFPVGLGIRLTEDM